MSAPLQVFIAYSRKDADYLAELRTHFTPLERSGKVKVWYDGKIEPGVVWETAIKANLHSADIILLLVSADAIASDYFYEKEMSDALDRHAAGTARVVPLIVRPCAWQETPLGDLQALPKDGLPVTEWPNRDAAYANAIGSLTTTLNLIRSERAAAATQAEQARHRSAEEARRKKAAADHQRQLEEKRKQDAADRLRKTEEERQRKAAAAQLREQQMATVGSTLRSPKVWGSGLVGVLALMLGNWLCDREHTTTLPETTTAQDTTSLTENKPVATDTQAATGVKTLSPEQLPKDVTVGQPKQQEEKPTAKEPPKVEKQQPAFTDPFADNMVRIGGGSFSMGCDPSRDGECKYDDEKPLHDVSVQPFSLCRYEVTQAQWRAVMGNDPPKLRFKGCDNCPVEGVSWDDVQKFLKKLNQLTGHPPSGGGGYRLPSEAEWEYAARGGNQSSGYKYAGSNNVDEVAWYTSNSDGKTHPVGKKKKNELGLFDMSGNVYEWCQDTWHGSYEGAPTNGSAWTSGGDQSIRVVRGGSWGNFTDFCRSAVRVRNNADYRFLSLGFRLAR